MKIKSILAGAAAFLVAGGVVFASSEKLQTPNGSYMHPTLGCIAVHAADCLPIQTPQNCEEDVLEDGIFRQIYENENNAPAGQPSVCENPLFKIVR